MALEQRQDIAAAKPGLGKSGLAKGPLVGGKARLRIVST